VRQNETTNKNSDILSVDNLQNLLRYIRLSVVMDFEKKNQDKLDFKKRLHETMFLTWQDTRILDKGVKFLYYTYLSLDSEINSIVSQTEANGTAIDMIKASKAMTQANEMINFKLDDMLAYMSEAERDCFFALYEQNEKKLYEISTRSEFMEKIITTLKTFKSLIGLPKKPKPLSRRQRKCQNHINKQGEKLKRKLYRLVPLIEERLAGKLI
jgi:hypothetical protein